MQSKEIENQGSIMLYYLQESIEAGRPLRPRSSKYYVKK